MKNLVQFIEACETGTDRSTFYNAATQQQESLEALHKAVLDHDRELYCLSQAMEGFNDYNRLLVVRNLLFNTGYVLRRDGKRRYGRYGKSDEFAARYGASGLEKDWTDLENRIIVQMVWNNIPIPRLLREWAMWRKMRLNNARSKRLVLEFLLRHRSLSGWALKYRPNLRRVLSHAWGDARTRRIRKAAARFLDQGSLGGDTKEFESWVSRYVGSDETARRQACETICFIFRDLRKSFDDRSFAQFVEAISDPEKMVGLPIDIAIGLRNRIHKDFPKKRLLESWETQRKLSKKQQVRLQRAGDREDVRVRMDLKSLSLVEILKYGYERGFDTQVSQAIESRLEADAGKCRFKPGHVAVVVDTSRSMYGKEDRKLHPVAVAMSIALLVERLAGRCDVIYTGPTDRSFPIPSGDTDLASAVLEAYKSHPEMVLLITDGYENVAAGTVNSLLRGLRAIGFNAPLVQLTPVMASEVGDKGGLRSASDSVYATAVKGAESIASMYEKFLLISASETDQLHGLKQYLLGKLTVKEIPPSIRQELARGEGISPEVHGILPIGWP